MVCVLFANGFEETEALCPLDLLKRAGADVYAVALDGSSATGKDGLVSVSCQMSAKEALLSDKKIEMLVFPGGMPGAANIDGAEITDKLIEKTQKDGGYLAAICAAPMVLGKRGLLRGKNATCFPGFEEYLLGAEHHPELGVVRDGNVITGRGMGVSYEFGIELVSCLYGREKAEELLIRTCNK